MKSKSRLFHLSKISMGTRSLVTRALVAEEEEGMVLSHWWHTCAPTLGALQFQHLPGALVSAHDHISLSRVLHSWNGLAWHGLKLPKVLGYGLATHTTMGRLGRLCPYVSSEPCVTALACMA